jgi:hypothetical protein
MQQRHLGVGGLGIACQRLAFPLKIKQAASYATVKYLIDE